MEPGQILAAGSLLLTTLLGVWIKLLSHRAFSAIDEKNKAISESCGELDECVRVIEKDIVRLSEFQKQVEKDIAQVKADLVREAQLMSNHLDVVHKKIDHIDEKLDKLRDRRQP